jgi:hypothetical protein
MKMREHPKRIIRLSAVAVFIADSAKEIAFPSIGLINISVCMHLNNNRYVDEKD